MARACIEHGDVRTDQPPIIGLLGAALPLPAAEVFLWPCNVQAWLCWNGVQTQWRVGSVGATGLDYGGVRAYLDDEGLAADDRRAVLEGIRAAERAALDVWAEQRERERERAGRGG